MSCTLMQVKIVEKYFYFSSTDFEYKCYIGTILCITPTVCSYLKV